MWVRARLRKLQKGCTRLTTKSDQVYKFLAHGRWLSLDTTSSSTTKTGGHHIDEILLKLALNTKSKCPIVSLLCLAVALHTILYLDDAETIGFL